MELTIRKSSPNWIACWLTTIMTSKAPRFVPLGTGAPVLFTPVKNGLPAKKLTRLLSEITSNLQR